VSKFKHRLTRIAGAALLPAALAVGVSAVPASAATQAKSVSHAASPNKRGSGYWEKQKGHYDSYYYCFKDGISYYYTHKKFKNHFDYSFYCDYHDPYWYLWIGYGDPPDHFSY